MSIRELIKSIINSHHPDSSKFSESNKIINEQNKSENSHLGNFYLNSGMKINIDNQSDPAAVSLKSLMDYIKKNWDSSGDNNDNGSSDNQEKNKTNLEDQSQDQSTDSDHTKPRSIDSVDLPEETTIKAMAVSILAETDGNCDLAKEVLNIGGLKMMKSMSPRGLDKLIKDLESISAQIEN